MELEFEVRIEGVPEELKPLVEKHAEILRQLTIPLKNPEKREVTPVIVAGKIDHYVVQDSADYAGPTYGYMTHEKTQVPVSKLEKM